MGSQKYQLIIWVVEYNKYSLAGLDLIELIVRYQMLNSPDIRYFATMSISIFDSLGFGSN